MSSSLTGILNMSQRSIANNQAALNVVSNNISNMNNGNYTKQRVEFSSINAYNTYNWLSSSGNMLIGQGAQIASISRNREQWLDNYVREQSADMGYYNQIGAMAGNIENMLNDELGSKGIQQSFSNFFKTSETLSGDPSNTAYRSAFVDAAKDIADRLNGMASTLKSQRNSAVGTAGDPSSFQSSQLNMSVQDLDKKLQQLADLNGKIAQSQNANGVSNDLLDQRDALLDELSGMIPLTTTTNKNNTINVIIDGVEIVKGGEKQFDLKAVQETATDPAKIQMVGKDGTIKKADITGALTSGSIKGILDSVSPTGDLSYNTMMKELDKISDAFAKEMNRVQTQVIGGKTPMCIDTNGKLIPATEPFFVTKDGSANFTADNIKINQNLLDDPKLVATGRVDITLPPAEWENAIGNAENMEHFNNIQKAKLADGSSITSFITSLVTTVGSKVQSINESGTAQKNILNQAASKRANITGVDLNEELTDLIKFQRAYEASARVFNAASEMMQLMTNLGK